MPTKKKSTLKKKYTATLTSPHGSATVELTKEEFYILTGDLVETSSDPYACETKVKVANGLRAAFPPQKYSATVDLHDVEGKDEQDIREKLAKKFNVKESDIDVY